MVNRELIEVFSEIAREKNVERSELGSIIESLFLHLVEKERGDASNCSVIVNLDKGEFEIYVEKEIVADIEDPVMEITLDEVAKIDSEMAKDLDVGDSYIEIIDPMIFGRRMIYMAKQFFSQKLQDVEKKYIYEDYASNQNIADAIYKMYSMKSEERKALGEKARKYVQSEFALENTIKMWDETLLELVKTHKQNPPKRWTFEKV